MTFGVKLPVGKPVRAASLSFMRSIKPSLRPWVRGGLTLFVDSMFEAGEEMSQGLIANRSLGKENDWGELWYEGSIGFGMRLFFGGGGLALRSVTDRGRGIINKRRQAGRPSALENCWTKE